MIILLGLIDLVYCHWITKYFTYLMIKIIRYHGTRSDMTRVGFVYAQVIPGNTSVLIANEAKATQTKHGEIDSLSHVRLLAACVPLLLNDKSSERGHTLKNNSQKKKKKKFHQ